MKKMIVQLLLVGVVSGSAWADETNALETVAVETNAVVSAEYDFPETNLTAITAPTIVLGGEIPLAADTLRIESVTCSTGGVWTVTSNLSLMRETLTINGSTMEVRVMRAAITTELDAETMQATLGDDYAWAEAAAQAGSFTPSAELKTALLTAVGAKLVGVE